MNERPFTFPLISGLSHGVLLPVVVLSIMALLPEAASGAELLAHYSFNEGAGKMIRDRSGYGRAGSNDGGVYVASPRGYALSLDGVDDRVEYGGSNGLRIRGSFAIAIWLRTDPDAARGTTRLIFGDTAARSVQRNFNVKIDKYEHVHVEWGNGESYVDLITEASRLAGGWHHMAVSCDAIAGKAVLYVDAKPVARKDVPFGATHADDGRRVRSGYWWDGNAFAGQLDDIKIFDDALTNEEIRRLYSKATDTDTGVDAPLTPSLTAKAQLAGPIRRDGLVAHYTFEEAAGNRLVDHSGRGNHAVIHSATWAKSPWGGALRFDGVDDYVNLGQPDDFCFHGDLTIEMWVRTPPTYPERKHPLFIGSSAADLAVQRHFNLRLDHTQRLRFEWGDGQRYSCILEKPWFLDGDWKYIAVVMVSGKAFFFYVNGQLVTAHGTDLPLTKNRGDDIHIGGWSHGYLRGDIAEVRLYGRALSAVEIQRNGGRPEEDCELLLNATGAYSYHRQQFLCDLFSSLEGTDAETIRVRVLEPASQRVVCERSLPIASLSGNAGHGFTRLALPGQSAIDGDHRLEVVLLDRQEEILHRHDAAIPYAKPPAWLDSKAGVTNAVLPPYTPCETVRGETETIVRTWGREHRFNGQGLLTQVHSAGKPLLAAPMAFHARVSESDTSWPASTPEQVSATPASVRLRSRSTSAGIQFDVETTVEYDGFIRFDCVLSAAEDVRLQRLTLDVPLAAEAARLFYAWPVNGTGLSGDLSEDWTGPFKPIVWIGNEQRGLSWVCESEQYWHAGDMKRAIEVVRSEKRTLLRFNLIGREQQLGGNHEFRYTFGLQATPVRPMTRTYWDMRVHRQRPYANEYDWPSKRINGVPALDYYADNGARALLVWRWWDAFGYTLPLGHEKRFPDLVKACHERKLKIVPYTIGFLLSDAAPEYRIFRHDMLVEPHKGFTGVNRLPGLPNQMAYFACPRGLWRDFVTATTAQCMDRYDTDGVYLDTTVRPEPCTNALHGCGWVREDGTRAPTYPIFAIRDMMKRLYAIVTTRQPDGFVDAHVYDCLNVPALAFATGYWNGEQLVDKSIKVQSLPLDRFRTEFMGHNLGIPADLLYYKLKDYEPSVALAILHDVPVRCEKDTDFEAIAAIYRVRDAFRCDQASFHGYWEIDSPIHLSGSDCYASYWRHPTNGILLAVSNLAAEPRTPRLTIDTSQLGLGPKIKAVDTRNESAVPADDNTIRVDLPSQSFMLIHVHSN